MHLNRKSLSKNGLHQGQQFFQLNTFIFTRASFIEFLQLLVSIVDAHVH